jgi:predicted TPR repeat methyltransferase
MGYCSPGAVAEVARELLDVDARILDVGAGSGLLGVALVDAGFTRLDAMDLTPAMLTEANRKHVYGQLRQGTLGDSLAYETGEYDGVVASGVLTTGHAPASCLDELVRITRPGGHVIFTLRSDLVPPGYEAKIAELERAKRWELVERGDSFQAMPTGEPEVLVRVWAFRVL